MIYWTGFFFLRGRKKHLIVDFNGGSSSCSVNSRLKFANTGKSLCNIQVYWGFPSMIDVFNASEDSSANAHVTWRFSENHTHWYQTLRIVEYVFKNINALLQIHTSGILSEEIPINNSLLMVPYSYRIALMFFHLSLESLRCANTFVFIIDLFCHIDFSNS